MTETPSFNANFWLAIVTAAPVLLVAFAATFEQLLTRNNETAWYRRPFDRFWAKLWIYLVPGIGVLLTLFAVLALAFQVASPVLEVVAVLALVALLIGVFSTGITLISLRKRFPPGRAWEKEAVTWAERRKLGKERDKREDQRQEQAYERRRRESGEE
ncbi:MAG TPA: hypothetical protein VF331_12985 [Polyangiales bacterium]